MRTIVLLAGLSLGAALFAATPTRAELGCTCVKLGAPTYCSSGVSQCTLKGGGVCVLPCDYQPPKKMARHHHHKKHKKM